MVKNPSKIMNKAKRAQIYAKYKEQKKVAKKKLKQQKLKDVEAIGEAPVKPVPRTIENTRVYDDSKINPDDLEVIGDEKDDEFSKYFSNEKVYYLHNSINSF